jgi:hypothetical protein
VRRQKPRPGPGSVLRVGTSRLGPLGGLGSAGGADLELANE